MRKTQSRARLALLSRGWLAGALLVVVALAATACVAPSAPQATPAPQATQNAAAPAASTLPAPPQATTGTGPSAPAATAEPGSQDAGVSSDYSPAAKFTTHWKGDPNAKVVIIEISDFQ